MLYCFQDDDLVRVYPPFVNFFEMSKDTLIRCDKMYPRFHAFLKVETQNYCYICCNALCLSVRPMSLVQNVAGKHLLNS